MKSSIQKFNEPHIGTFCSLVIPLILLLQISLPGVAICLGSDGHAALESYSEGLCNEMTSKSESQHNSTLSLQSANSLNSRHCGSCIDIPISDDNTENKVMPSNDLMSEIDIHSLAVYQLTSQISIETTSQSLIVQELITGKNFLDTLQTTILTC